MLKNKTILITGGTGSFGKEFIKQTLKNYKPKKIIIFSRDELKQYELKKTFSEKQLKILRFFIGDVRDKERVSQAFNKVDIVKSRKWNWYLTRSKKSEYSNSLMKNYEISLKKQIELRK